VICATVVSCGADACPTMARVVVLSATLATSLMVLHYTPGRVNAEICLAGLRRSLEVGAAILVWPALKLMLAMSPQSPSRTCYLKRTVDLTDGSLMRAPEGIRSQTRE